MSAYLITAALDKGFYVSEHTEPVRKTSDPVLCVGSDIICAGAMSECLDYVRLKFEGEEPVAGVPGSITVEES